MKLNVPICQSPIFTTHHWLTHKDRCHKGNSGPRLASELPCSCLLLCDTLTATHTLPFLSHFSIRLLMAFLITDYYDPLSEVVPEEKDMQVPYFCQESSLTVQCRGSIYEKTLPLLRPELFPSRRLQRHDAALLERRAHFWPVFPDLDMERNAHNKEGNWENLFWAL